MKKKSPPLAAAAFVLLTAAPLPAQPNNLSSQAFQGLAPQQITPNATVNAASLPASPVSPAFAVQPPAAFHTLPVPVYPGVPPSPDPVSLGIANGTRSRRSPVSRIPTLSRQVLPTIDPRAFAGIDPANRPAMIRPTSIDTRRDDIPGPPPPTFSVIAYNGLEIPLSRGRFPGNIRASWIYGTSFGTEGGGASAEGVAPTRNIVAREFRIINHGPTALRIDDIEIENVDNRRHFTLAPLPTRSIRPGGELPFIIRFQPLRRFAIDFAAVRIHSNSEQLNTVFLIDGKSAPAFDEGSDNTRGGAIPIELAETRFGAGHYGAIEGRFESLRTHENDPDYYRIVIPPGPARKLQAIAAPGGPAIDTVATLFRERAYEPFLPVAISDEGGFHFSDFHLEDVTVHPGTYYLKVELKEPYAVAYRLRVSVR